jgi:UDP-N-acetylmuramyl pentapeptide phosphotransferase/UDP-N-acetylglucosamine-1-phosphate transferase
MSAQTVLILLFFNIIIFFNFDYISNKLKFYDHPDKTRKLHKKPISLLGGVIFFFSFTIIFFSEIFLHNNLIKLNFSKENILIFYLFSLVIFSIYLYDDIKNINPNLKLLLLAIFIILYLVLDSNLILSNLRVKFTIQTFFLNYFSIFFTVLCFLLFINAFNMFDGINLQAGIYSLFIFIVFFIFTKNSLFIYLIIPLIFFLTLNYFNKCFLGNSGAALLAFFISVISIKLHNINKFFVEDIFLLMCIPGYDLLRLAIVRLFKKKNPFYPDRNHLHHLILDTYGYKIALFGIFCLILIINVLNLFYQFSSILLILLSMAIYLTIIFYLKKKKP